MKGLAIINPGSLKSIERSIFLVGSITLATSIFLLGSAGYNYFRYNDTETQLASTKQQVQTLSETISKAKRLKFTEGIGKELSVVQNSIDQLAKANDCLLTEVNSSNDEGAYMSRYTKSGEAGWKQVGLTCQMIGSLSGVMALLKDLSQIAVPIEFQTIEVTPLESPRNGRPQVLAKVSLQLMKQEITR